MTPRWFYRVMYVAEPCACVNCADGRGWGLCLRLPPKGDREILTARWLRCHSIRGYHESDAQGLQAEFPESWLLPSERTATEEELDKQEIESA